MVSLLAALEAKSVRITTTARRTEQPSRPRARPPRVARRGLGHAGAVSWHVRPAAQRDQGAVPPSTTISARWTVPTSTRYCTAYRGRRARSTRTFRSFLDRPLDEIDPVELAILRLSTSAAQPPRRPLPGGDQRGHRAGQGVRRRRRTQVRQRASWTSWRRACVPLKCAAASAKRVHRRVELIRRYFSAAACAQKTAGVAYGMATTAPAGDPTGRAAGDIHRRWSSGTFPTAAIPSSSASVPWRPPPATWRRWAPGPSASPSR